MKLFSFWRSLATFRVRIALNLKGLSPEVFNVDLMKGQQRTPDYCAVNPQMLIPALVEDDGRILFQSLAILEYLDEIHPHPPLLPKDPFDRARVRGLALVVACDAHPLVVPRVRNYLEHELKLDEPTRLKWIRHWSKEALATLETHLSRDPQTGRYCHGDTITTADLCLVSHVAGAKLFEVDLGPYPTVARIAEACLVLDAVSRAHPLKQPGAPAGGTH
ncbi:MAG: maleylacetoacetate isomerase [Rhizobiales bacterium]|nr:maleylacetoacetate isomerase [Hyphomicrobiales bacterium]